MSNKSELLSFILNHEEQFRRARLASLYSDFRVQRTTNPDGYAANVAAWQDALEHAARAGVLPTSGGGLSCLGLSTDENLMRALESKEWGRPLALGTVVDEAISQRRMVPLQDFLHATSSTYNRTWRFRPWGLFSWGMKLFDFVSGASADERLRVGQYVLVHNVEEVGKRIMAQLSDRRTRVDRIYPRVAFEKQAAKVVNAEAGLTKDDLAIILTYLARDKKELAFDSQTVKFKGPDESTPVITQQDTTIASLKMLISGLDKEVESLTSRINGYTLSARKAVANQNRTSALASLRSKKFAESTLMERSQVLTQLEELYTKIEQAADQVEIVRVMEASAGVLRSLNAEAGGIEKVEDIVQDLREEMTKVDEIGRTLNEVAEGTDMIDDNAVDDELEAMEREERQEKEKREAERTRRRLEEIEDTKNNASLLRGSLGQEAQPTKPAEKGTEASIEDDIGAMHRMSIDDPDITTKERSHSPRRADQLSAAVPDG
ncbi:Snf7 [Lasallia pustulata]|uniref:Snf7 n=1 Tax=Lasallia pustulata TaxID=136370 RepID=A0A1W5CT12_9LECA|nr:Snf7 [Lasallia pustulata]